MPLSLNFAIMASLFPVCEILYDFIMAISSLIYTELKFKYEDYIKNKHEDYIKNKDKEKYSDQTG